MSISNESNDTFEAGVQKVHLRPRIFYAINVGWLISMALISWFAVVNWNTNISDPEEILTLSLGQLIIAAQITWLALSIRVIGVSEVAAVVLYNLPMTRVRRGPKFILFGFFQLFRFPASVHQNQFPGDPELIQKGDDKLPLETVEVVQKDGTVLHKQKVRPIRITTAKPKESLGDEDILNTQMTVEFSFWVRWIATDPFELIINVSGNLDDAVKQMRDAGESLLNNEVTKLTPSELIDQFKELRNKLFEAIKQSVNEWGIDVIDVGLTAPDLSHEMSAALRNVASTKAEAKTKVIAAEAERIRLHTEGKGQGQAQEERLAGEGRGYKRLARSIGVSPEKVLEAQVTRDTVGEADLILGTDGLTQAIGLGSRLLNRNNPSSNNQEDKGDEK